MCFELKVWSGVAGDDISLVSRRTARSAYIPGRYFNDDPKKLNNKTLLKIV